jgi:hypothetical protein
MCERKFQEAKLILDAKGATGIGTPMEVSDFAHLILSLATATSANLTVKFQGSIQHDMPDFNAAQSVTNMWDYIQVKDLEDGSSIDGDVGIAPAGTDDFRQFELNVNALKWICAVVTARSAGSVTVKCKPFSNQ